MRRHALLLAVAVAAAVPLLVLAQGPQGPPAGRGRPGLLPMLHHLNLTDAQKEQLKALADADHQAGPPKTLELEQKLHAAIFTDPPDLQAIDTLKSALDAARADELDHHIQHMQKVAQILTPEQKKQLLSMQPAAHGWSR